MASKGLMMISDKDNVATALLDIEPENEVLVRLGRKTMTVKSLERIPFGCKMAIVDIAEGASVVRYGESIGVASCDIKRGELVHIHNIQGARGRGDLAKGGDR